MRVLTVVKDLNLGGTQRVAQNLTLGVRDRGVEVALFAHEGLGTRAAMLEAEGVTLFGPLDGKADVFAQVIAWEPDIVHIHRSGYPNLRETTLIRTFREAGAKIVETNVFARFDHTLEPGLIDVHAQLSEWCMLKWRLWSGSRGGASVVLPNAVDTSRFERATSEARQRIRDELGVAEGTVLFGRIGQPIAEKWDPAIFEVFAQGVAQGWDIALLLVGAPAIYPALAEGLPKAAARRIFFIESRNDDSRLMGLYSAMDAFLHLAKIGESFGMVLCEAMLCEVPVITLSTPLRDNSQLEVIQHGVGGFVATDQDGLLKAMDLLRGDLVAREAMGRRARQSVLDRFSLPIVAEKAIAIYSALLAKDARALPERLSGLAGVQRDMAWMQELSTNSFGHGLRLRDRIGIALIHSPIFYRLFRRLKTLQAR